MNKIYIKYLLLFPFYILIQILVLNQVLVSTYINPFLYLILIINLPVKVSKIFLFIYAFMLGFVVDLFSFSIGFHSTACILIAFMKNWVNKITIPHNILSDTDEIKLKKVGKQAYISFSIILIFIHHGCLFILENMYIDIKILVKILFSTSISLIVILITELFVKKKK